MSSPQSSFSLSSVLSETLAIFSRNPISPLMIGLVCSAPTIVTGIAVASKLDADPAELLPVLALQVFTAMIAPYLSQAALTTATVAAVDGNELSFRESLRRGARRVFPTLGACMLAGFAVMGGMLLFVIPGLLLALAFMLVVPVAVLEDGGVKALRRSRELTRGKRGTLFLLSLCYAAVPMAIAFGYTQIPDPAPWMQAARDLAIVPFSVFGAMALAVTYALLRKDEIASKQAG